MYLVIQSFLVIYVPQNVLFCYLTMPLEFTTIDLFDMSGKTLEMHGDIPRQYTNHVARRGS